MIVVSAVTLMACGGGGSKSTGGCTSDSSCPDGNICKDSICLEKVTKPACTADSDCVSDDQFCDDDGLCYVSGTTSCTENKDCPEGELCKKSFCATPAPDCTDDTDCGVGNQCEDGNCYKSPPSGDVIGDEGPPPPPPCNDDSDEDFTILFGYKGRIPGIPPVGNQDEYDLRLMQPIQKQEPVKLTDFSLKEEGKTCQYGCLVDEGMSYIAVNGAPPDAEGFDFQMGLFNACMQVQLVKGVVLENKAHFAFAGHYIYYSERTNCNGPSCQYQIFRLNLEDPTDKQLLIPFFPPPEDVDWIGGHSTFKGHFKVSPDGESLVLLSPTIRSQRIYLWTNGTLHEMDYLCENFQNDQCVGAGSLYSDVDPVAISPDSSTIVHFSISDRALQVRRFSTVDPSEIRPPSNLLTVSGGDYNDLACTYRKSWQWTHVHGQPTFTPDGKHVLFIGRADCGEEKPLTGIIKIDPTWIGDLTPVEEDELDDILANPTGEIPGNTEVQSIAVSPDGKRVVFTATPQLTTNWKQMNDTDKRHKTDAEVYKMSICGGDKMQLTSNLKYKATTVQVMEPPEMPNCPVPLFE